MLDIGKRPAQSGPMTTKPAAEAESQGQTEKTCVNAEYHVAGEYCNQCGATPAK